MASPPASRALLPLSMEQKTSEDWGKTWTDIDTGGPKRWKHTEQFRDWEDHFARLQRHGAFEARANAAERDSVFIPMSGDCPFAAYVFRRGFSVSAVDFVATATARLRDSLWVPDEGDATVCHSFDASTAGAAFRVYTQDVFKDLPAERARHTVLYDRHAFGATAPADRERYLATVSNYLRPDALVLLDGVTRGDGTGPPFDISRAEVEKYFGPRFTILEEEHGAVDLVSADWKSASYVLRFRG
jgi:Thiopurine S-methyltransferase (TPMT)